MPRCGVILDRSFGFSFGLVTERVVGGRIESRIIDRDEPTVLVVGTLDDLNVRAHHLRVKGKKKISHYRLPPQDHYASRYSQGTAKR